MDDLQKVSPARRALTWLVCYLVALQPVMPAVAAAITPVTPGTQISAAGNGVPVVNIATPNAAGISHNQYQQYNVGKEGVILNNATAQLNATQLGGLIQNNPNLKAGHEAQAIINEVTGAGRSQLQGYTEVAGKAANVMVANPYGITCNGCGFINTPAATLTTGKPEFDSNGNLSALEVSKGTVSIEGQGLDGSAADAVAIVARATEINAGIHAKALSVIVGANRVSKDGTVTPINGAGAAPAVAVDTGALGGMYANRIHLVSSESGLGVNLGNLVAKQGDITLNASGKLALRNSLSSGDLHVGAQSVEMRGDHKSSGATTVTAQNGVILQNSRLASDKSITLQSGTGLQLTDSTLTAGSGIDLSAGELAADSRSRVDTAGIITLNAGEKLDNAGQLVAGKALSLNASTLTNSGELVAQAQMDVVSERVDNQGRLQGGGVSIKSSALHNSGALQSTGGLSLEGNTLDQSGILGAAGETRLTYGQRISNGLNANILADGGVTATAGEFEQNGMLSAGKGISLSGEHFSSGFGAKTISKGDISLRANQDVVISGELQSNGMLSAQTEKLRTTTEARLQGKNVYLQAQQQAELGGTQAAAQQLEIDARQITHNGKSSADRLTLKAAETTDSSGSLVAGNLLHINAAQLRHSGTASAGMISLNVAQALNNSGSFATANQLQATTNALDNSGTLAAAQLLLSSTRTDNSGLLQGTQSLTMSGDNLNNAPSGTIATTGDLALYLPDFTNSGLLSSGGLLHLSGDRLVNSGEINAHSVISDNTGFSNLPDGKLLAVADARLNNAQLNNNGQIVAAQLAVAGGALLNAGHIQGTSGLMLSADTLTNRERGEIMTAGQLTLNADELNSAGLLQGKQITLTAGSWRNRGTVLSAEDAQLAADYLDNSGRILGQKSVQLLAKTLTLNSRLINRGLVQGNDALNLQGAEVINHSDGQLQTAGMLDVNAGSVTNQGSLQADGLTLSAKTWQNGGTTRSTHTLTAAVSGALTNSGSLLSQQNMDVQADELSNTGTLAADSLTLDSARLTNNTQGSLLTQDRLMLSASELVNYGLIQGGSSTVHATRQAGNNGKLLAGGQLTFTTPQLTNTGWLQAGQLTLNADDANNSGTLLAVRQGILTGAQLQNQGMVQGGDLSVNYQQLSSNGTFFGGQQLTVNADHVNQQARGKLYSGGNLTLTGGSFEQLGQVIALGDALLKLSNNFVSHDTLAAGRRLSVSSDGSLENRGTMQGQGLTLTAGGEFTNNGQLTAGNADTSIAGNRITLNSAGSFQSGGNTSLNSRSDIQLNGFTGTLGSLTLSSPGSLVKTALLYAGQNLSLFANSIKNQGGDILAGDSLWMQGDAAGKANSEIRNVSGTIESERGDITINTAHLLNQWESVNVGKTTTENVANGYGSIAPGTVELPRELFQSDELQYYFHEIPRSPAPPFIGSIWLVKPLPVSVAKNKGILVARTTSGTEVMGQAGRIAAGRNLAAQVNQLDNSGSYILAGQNLTLSGATLNNQSYLSGTQAVWRIFKPSDSYSSYDSVKNAGDTFIANNLDRLKGSREKGYTFNGSTVNLTNTLTYVATDSYRTEQADSIRGVIQANGNLSTRFDTLLNNSESQDVRGTITPTLSRPGLNTAPQPVINDGVTSLPALATDAVNVGSADWIGQITDAIKQVNGGIALNQEHSPSAALTNHSASTVQLSPITGASGLENNPYSLYQQDIGSGKFQQVNTSAYPLPQGSNGYFTAAADPKSPYLIVANPKLDGLGTLDKNIYNTLYQLSGQQPPQAPAETSRQYTDEKAMLGSSYLLGKLDLKPDYDYRLLGDAAFDTRYVSNALLSQTGNRYLHGVGSDLKQMQYLMDNAQAAAKSLNLQTGVTLSAKQISSLNHSILWWEAASINGETVLVPKLYLVADDTTVNNGSIIAGGTVTNEGEKVSNNGSTLLAQNGMRIDSQNGVDNLNTALINAGGDLSIHSPGDINNIGSAIKGKQVVLESVNGSINQITRTSQTDNSSRLSHSIFTEQGERSTIASLDDLLLKAGKNITLRGTDLHAGGNVLMSAADNVAILANESNSLFNHHGRDYKSIASVGSTVSAGGELSIRAGHDLTVNASDLAAANNLTLNAGNSLSLLSAQHNTVDDTSYGNSHAESVDRSTLSSGQALRLAAGQDITSQATAIASDGEVALHAGRDINLNAEKVASGFSSKSREKTLITETVRQQGTEIASGGNTLLSAGRDINATASETTAKQDITLNAGNDVNLNTATESDYYYKETLQTKKGFLSKKTTHTIQKDSSTHEKGTLLSGENVAVSAGHNLTVSGSAIAADLDVNLQAGKNLVMAAATETQSHYEMEKHKKSGLLGSGGLGFSIGSQSSRHELDQKGVTQSQSVRTVGSSQGSVSITAGDRLHVAGADLVAGKDLTLSGDSVQIDPGRNRLTRKETFESKQSGLTLALSGTVGSALNTAVTTARKEGDDRLNALQNTQAALSGVQAAQALEMDKATTAVASAKNTLNGLKDGDKGAEKGATSTVGVTVSYGSQSSKSETITRSNQANGSTLNAGENLSITATGKGRQADSGDIAIAGSQLKAGKDLTLDAGRDILLSSAGNSESTRGKNSSKGGNLGVGIGVGSGGYGFSVSAGVNAAKGHEKGSGLTHSETTLDAGSGLNLTSGRDTTLQGAQASGDKITVDAGRNLTLASEQDSDRYDAKQGSVSGGVSIPIGAGTGSASISASRDKLHSNFDSVNEQTGLFAGSGGYDVKVKEHTQLDGAVMGSGATAEKNSLETGTLGWRDIHNRADYRAQHQGGGFNTGGSIGSNLLSNAGSMPLSGANHKGHAEGTTRAAVSEGSVIIHDKDQRQQDVATLSRDVEHANDGSISPIFDEEKEQRRLKEAQLIGELGMQVGDIARTQGEIAATKAATEKLAKASTADRKQAAEQWQKANPGKVATEQDITGQVYQNLYNQALTDSKQGTGGSVQRAIQAATAAVQGLVGNNIGQALTGGAAPYLAKVVKQYTGDNPAANTMAHAVLGAVSGYASGNSALAGAGGAATAELIAPAIIASMGWDKNNLSEEQKQSVSALSQLAAGLAGAAVTGDTAGALTAAQTGKNAVENNSLSLPKGMADYGQAVASWDQYAQDNNLTPEQKKAGLDKLATGDLPEGANITKVIVNGYKDGVLIAGAAYLGPAASVGKVVGGTVIAEIANGTHQWFDLSKPDNENKGWDYTGSISAGITGALAPGRGVWQNAGITAGGTLFTDGPDKCALIGTGSGWVFGTAVGIIAPPLFNPVLGSGSAPVGDIIGSIGGEFISNAVKDGSNEKKK